MTFASRPLQSVLYAIHLVKSHEQVICLGFGDVQQQHRTYLVKGWYSSLLCTSPADRSTYKYCTSIRTIPVAIPDSILPHVLSLISTQSQTRGIASLVIPTASIILYYVSMVIGSSGGPVHAVLDVHVCILHLLIGARCVVYLGGTYPGYCKELVWVDRWDCGIVLCMRVGSMGIHMTHWVDCREM